MIPPRIVVENLVIALEHTTQKLYHISEVTGYKGDQAEEQCKTNEAIVIEARKYLHRTGMTASDL